MEPPGSKATEPLVRGDFALVQQFRIEVTAGPNQGQSYLSDREQVVVGTSRRAHLVVSDPTVSRFHCEITVEPNRVILRDLESTNGTLVNGVPLFRGCLLPGAVVTVGKTKLRFELGRDPVKVALSNRDRFGDLVGVSPSMRSVFLSLERAARSDATLLLLGETGTGKDVAAESVHAESARAAGPFVAVDCGAVAPDLLESELFGHERGAFTGADRARAGAFEAASGGTLLLDEIGELRYDLQPKLLRALEEKRIRRVGGSRVIDVDVRVIAATNRDLRAEVNARRFRDDLFYRLAVIELTMPPLRGRPEDLPILVRELLERLGAGDRAEAFLAHDEVRTDLAQHAWPGNVRELRNYLERSLVFNANLPPLSESLSDLPLSVDVSQTLRTARENFVRWFERQYMEQILAHHGKNVSAAARAAGVNRTHFHRLLARTRR